MVVISSVWISWQVLKWLTYKDKYQMMSFPLNCGLCFAKFESVCHNPKRCPFDFSSSIQCPHIFRCSIFPIIHSTYLSDSFALVEVPAIVLLRYAPRNNQRNIESTYHWVRFIWIGYEPEKYISFLFCLFRLIFLLLTYHPELPLLINVIYLSFQFLCNFICVGLISIGFNSSFSEWDTFLDNNKTPP